MALTSPPLPLRHPAGSASRVLRRAAALLGTATLGATLLVAPATPASASTSCPVTWGSTTQSTGVGTQATLTGVHTDRQACFDRLVVDLAPGTAPGYRVSYVPHITQAASGAVISTRGGAALQVVVHAPAYDDAGRSTYLPRNLTEVTDVGGYRTFRQVVWGSSSEGDSTLGVGVRARLPFRVFTLPSAGGGSRLVVDVAHSW